MKEYSLTDFLSEIKLKVLQEKEDDILFYEIDNLPIDFKEVDKEIQKIDKMDQSLDQVKGQMIKDFLNQKKNEFVLDVEEFDLKRRLERFFHDEVVAGEKISRIDLEARIKENEESLSALKYFVDEEIQKEKNRFMAAGGKDPVVVFFPKFTTAQLLKQNQPVYFMVTSIQDWTIFHYKEDLFTQYIGIKNSNPEVSARYCEFEYGKRENVWK